VHPREGVKKGDQRARGDLESVENLAFGYREKVKNRVPNYNLRKDWGGGCTSRVKGNLGKTQGETLIKKTVTNTIKLASSVMASSNKNERVQ